MNPCKFEELWDEDSGTTTFLYTVTDEQYGHVKLQVTLSEVSPIEGFIFLSEAMNSIMKTMEGEE